MREQEHFDTFYDELKKIHHKYFCNWRYGQLCNNFFSWLASEKQTDWFFSSDNELLTHLKEFAKMYES